MATRSFSPSPAAPAARPASDNHAATVLSTAELLGALSHALDLTEGQPEGHCKRCCWIGTRIGIAAGLDGEALSDLYFTLLLKDLGCSSNAARICELYLADDIGFKRDFKYIDGSLGAALRFVFSKTGLQSGLTERIRAIVNILQNGGDISRELIETRCHRGAEIAARMHFGKRVQDGIRSLDEHWDGGGKPVGLKGAQIPFGSRVALLAQVIDVFHAEHGRNAALKEVVGRCGEWFDPELVDLTVELARQEDFWAPLGDGSLEARLNAMEPAQRSAAVDDDYLDDVASAFADVVDAKSPFTAGHSERVTLYADMVAEQTGFSPERRRQLRRAALLHDIGKLAVSNQILDKPGKLNDAEWAAIRAHPRHSEEILLRVSAFRDIAAIAGAHHERLDGKGYPRGLGASDLPMEARILAVADVFDALSADRPYRAAMPIAEALAIMDRDTGTAFDADCVAALKRGLRLMGARAE